MRVRLLTAGLLASAIVSVAGLTSSLAAGCPTRVTCLCNCPDYQKLRHHAVVRPVMPHRVVRRVVHRVLRGYGETYYSYAAAAPVIRREWHGQWRRAPNDAFIPGPEPMAYYQPRLGCDPQGLEIDGRDWTGGVGGEGDGGGGGYGQLYPSNGGSAENGPTYNDYNQSFQFNPSHAEPFQNRSMGGFAPATTTK